MSTPELGALRAFRQQVYTLFGCRRDALFELLDALRLQRHSVRRLEQLSYAVSLAPAGVA